MSVRSRCENRGFVLKLKTTNVETIPTKSKPVRDSLTPRNSLPLSIPMLPSHNRSYCEYQNENKASVPTTVSSSHTDSRKFELHDSILCFRRFLNDEELKFRECHSKEELDSDPLRHTINSLSPQQQRRNQTIIEETEQTESILPESDHLDHFYRFLSCKYETLGERLAYCQLVLRLEQQYARQPQARHRHRLKFQPAFLCWYINQWLGNMAFNHEENRHRVVRSIISFSKEESIARVVDDCYSNLFGSYLPSRLHIMLLLEVCRHGWQYFIFFAVRFLAYVKNSVQEDETLTEAHWGHIEILIRNQ